ncbi:hypothetical protein, partial [Streptomyces sp. NPDC006289]|uniref:hypothetical protein n=1 Tax=Streptomyces sp. NPDC006289 TaxID=3156744 RepID=UPI0033AC0C36
SATVVIVAQRVSTIRGRDELSSRPIRMSVTDRDEISGAVRCGAVRCGAVRCADQKPKVMVLMVQGTRGNGRIHSSASQIF